MPHYEVSLRRIRPADAILGATPSGGRYARGDVSVPAEPPGRGAAHQPHGDPADRNQRVGWWDCVKEAPEGFKLDEDTVAVFVAPEAVERERLLRACDACTVDAITVWDSEDRQLVPPLT